VAKDTARPTQEFVKAKLVPKIKSILDAKHSDVRDSGCIALGRTGGAPEVPVLVGKMTDKSAYVREAAVIALGLLQCPESIDPLLHVIHADQDGQRMRGGREPEWRMRAMAAACLALCGDNEKGQVKAALKQYSASTTINKGIRVNAAVGLGLLKGDREYCADLINHLKELATKSRYDDFVRAHAVVALGRVVDRNGLQVDPDTVSFLVRIAKRDKVAHLRRSAIIALGTIFKDRGDKTDLEAMKVLRSEFTKGKGGNMSQNFAAIALGKIGGDTAFKDLQKVAAKDRKQHGAYAALGLAILCDKLRDKKDDDNAGSTRIMGLSTLRTAFKKCRNPQIKGGFAIALGIARDQEAGPLLLDAMKKSQEIRFRGYLAIALGMVNHQAAVGYMRTVLINADNLPQLKEQVAIGLGLMGSRDVAQTLVKQLKEGNTTAVTTSIAKAVGFVGDRDTIPPLVQIMTDTNAMALTRAYATLALATIGDPAPIPVLSEFFFGHNFLASTQPLMMLQRIMNS